MKPVLLDTNIVSILFNPKHSLYGKCFNLIAGQQCFISFMTRSELLLWPRLNNWGTQRREELVQHIEFCTTLFADEETCRFWVDVVVESRISGRPIATADAWIAATARQWDLPLITTDYRDYEHISGIKLVKVN